MWPPLWKPLSDTNCECLRNVQSHDVHHSIQGDSAEPATKGLTAMLANTHNTRMRPRHRDHMWHVYDSNTSQAPTASHRRGHKAEGGDLKARAPSRARRPHRPVVCQGVWPAMATKRPALAMRAGTHSKRKAKREFILGMGSTTPSLAATMPLFASTPTQPGQSYRSSFRSNPHQNTR